MTDHAQRRQGAITAPCEGARPDGDPKSSPKSRRPGRRRSTTGFSLVEVALAIGVVAFALVAILGMVPVAVDAARESRDETRATFIARSLIETLESGDNGQGVVETSPAAMEPDGSRTAPPTFEVIDFPTAGSPAVRHFAHDANGALLGEMTTYNYETGGGAPDGAVYLARLTLTRRPDGLVHTEALIETPATAARANRSRYPFVTLINP